MKQALIVRIPCILLMIAVSLCVCGGSFAADTKKAAKDLEKASAKEIGSVKVPDVPPPTRVDVTTPTAGGFDVGGSTVTSRSSGAQPKEETTKKSNKPTTEGAPIIKK